MTIKIALLPMLSLLSGILILVWPKLMNYIVAIYLILFGIIGLFPGLRI